MNEPAMTTIHLPRRHADTMIEHARQGKPDEVCGLVARDSEGRVTAVLPVENAARNKTVTYYMHPTSQHRAFMAIEEQGWEMAGLYHSHPATRAYPSPTDQGMAFDPDDGLALYPDTVYFIVSLADDENPDIRAFLLPAPRAITELSLIIDA